MNELHAINKYRSLLKLYYKILHFVIINFGKQFFKTMSFSAELINFGFMILR